jgi:hypothetical protein
MTFQPQQPDSTRFLYWLEGCLEILLELSCNSDYEAYPDLGRIMDKLQKEIERIEGRDPFLHKNKSSAENISEVLAKIKGTWIGNKIVYFDENQEDDANHAPSPSPNDITDVEVHSNSFVGKYPECHDPAGRFQPINKIKDVET